nr:2295_t:CDS:2 [Entrophospora candida]
MARWPRRIGVWRYRSDNLGLIDPEQGDSQIKVSKIKSHMNDKYAKQKVKRSVPLNSEELLTAVEWDKRKL